jgi:hypothetical protein
MSTQEYSTRLALASLVVRHGIVKLLSIRVVESRRSRSNGTGTGASMWLLDDSPIYPLKLSNRPVRAISASESLRG